MVYKLIKLKRTLLNLTLLLTLIMLTNYQSYCKSIPIDTIITIKFRDSNGVFIDSVRLVKVTKKVMLADSLLLINKLQESIINRQEEQRNNAIKSELNFKEYIKASNQELVLVKKSYDLKLRTKDIIITILSLTNIIAIGKILLK